MNIAESTTIRTQLRAQQATTATLACWRGRLRKGQRVTLMWELSRRDRFDGPLSHVYTAFGYDALGHYVMEYVEASDLELIEFSTGTK